MSTTFEAFAQALHALAAPEARNLRKALQTGVSGARISYAEARVIYERAQQEGSDITKLVGQLERTTRERWRKHNEKLAAEKAAKLKHAQARAAARKGRI